MKKILFVLLLLWGVAEAQPVPGYTWFNSRNNFFALAANDLLVPAGTTPARGSGSWVRSGALFYDSTGVDTGLYVYHAPYWVKIGGSSSAVGLQDVITNNAQLTSAAYNNIDVNTGTLQIGESAGLGAGKGIRIDMANDAIALQSTAGSQNLLLNTNTGDIRIQAGTPNKVVRIYGSADSIIIGRATDYNKTRMKITGDSIFIKNPTSIGSHPQSNVMIIDSINGQIRMIPQSAITGGPQGIFANSQINNYLDSLRHRPLNLYDRPDTAYGGGNSIMAPATDSAMMNRITRRFAIPIVNFGVSSTGIASTAASFFSRVNPGHGGMSVFIPTINNISTGKFVPKNVNTLVNGFLSLYVNSFVKSYIPASSLTRVSRHGTWSVVNPVTAWGGKFTTGISTATANDSIVIHNIHFETALAIGVRMSDSVNVAGAHGAWYLRDTVSGTVVQSATFGTNQQSIGISDGTNNNFQIPGAIIINGLDSSKYYSLKIVSEQSTNTLAIDYIATLLDPVFCKPMVFYNATYLSAAQYASLGITQATIDSCNAKIDSIAAVLAPWGRPVYVINNPTFNPTTMTSDGLHWNDLGYLTQFRLLTDQISSFNNPSDGSLSNSYGQMYATVNGLARTVGVNAGNGLRNVGGYLQNILTTGEAGGGRSTGGIASGEGYNIRSNPENDGVVTIGSMASFNESTKRTILGSTSGGATALNVIGNPSLLTDHLITATLAASGSGNLFLGTNSAGTMQARIFSGGAYQFTGSGVSYPSVASGTMQISGGTLFFDALGASAGSGIPLQFRTSTTTIMAGSSFNVNALAASGTELAINDGGITGFNLRVETDNDANSFVVNGTSDKVIMGSTTGATAWLTLKAGTTTNASLNIPTSTFTTTPATGNVEFDGTNYTGSVSTTRYTFAKTLTATGTLDFGNTAAGAQTDLTITVTGAATGDAVFVGAPNGSVSATDNVGYWGWVSAANTVTVRFNNGNLVAAVDPASGTFRVVVAKY